MLTRLYVEALLVDPEQADQVWQQWNDGEISDDEAEQEWRLIAMGKK